MKVALGSDHGGFALKEAVKAYLTENGFEYQDFGTYDTKSCDYPVYAKAAARAVADGNCGCGIVICTTGIGVSIAANKIEGIRCALCHDVTTAHLCREHNNANMLAMGAGVVGEKVALEIVATFLHTEFSGEERHVRRIGEIETA